MYQTNWEGISGKGIVVEPISITGRMRQAETYSSLRQHYVLPDGGNQRKEGSLARGNNNVVLGAGSKILLRNSAVSQHSVGKTSPRYSLEGGGVRML